jgi:metal-sulfur cluster biosynthetic enzyme
VAQEIYPKNDVPEIVQVLNDNKSINGYKSITDKNDVIVAIDIRRMNRFSTEKIENKIKKQLEEKFPEKDVLVTGDLKIRWEVEKIIKEKMQTDKLKKSIDQIKSLSKEAT